MSACIRSGYCCQRGICPFGEWDEEAHQCKHLTGDTPGNFACGIYDWIIEHSPRLWGTPDDIYERLSELADMGLTNWVFLQQSRGTFVGGADAEKLELIKNLGEVAKRVA